MRGTEKSDEKVRVNVLEELESLVFSESSMSSKAALSLSLEETNLPLPGDHTKCSPEVDAL